MTEKNESISRLLHWSFAVFVLLMLALGFYMANSQYSGGLYYWHKSLGVIFLAAVGIRVYWSLTQPWQSAAAGAKHEWLAHWAHRLLLLLLLAMPLTGFLSSAFSGFSVHLFGWVIVPQNINAVGQTEPFSALTYETAKALHEIFGYLFTGIIVLHIAAALKHHFIDRDSVLGKMLSGKR